MALESFRRAVELDPNFADAWAALANRESFAYFGHRTPEQLARARHAMEMAVKLQPDASESYAAAGSFYYYCYQDFDRALENLKLAHARAPNNSFVLMLTGAVKRRQGKLDESIQLMQKAGLLDPRNNDVWVNLARSFRGARKFAEAHMMFDRALSVAPQQAAILAEKAETYTAAGDLESAERLLAPLPRELRNEAFDDYLWVLELRRDFEAEMQALSEALEKSPDEERRFWARGTLATLHFLQGRPDQAKPIPEELRRSTEAARAAGDESLGLRERLIGIASLLGDRETVKRESEALLRQTSRDRWYYPVAEETTAVAFALLGDAESALPHLEKALSMPALRGITPFYLRNDWRWDKIRTDPRFQKLANGKH